jgi:hypothetical protein
MLASSRPAVIIEESGSPRNCCGILLFGHETGNPPDRVKMIDSGLMSFNRDSEMMFQERDELQRADGIKDPAGNQQRLGCQLFGILAGKEFAQNKVVNHPDDLFHDSLLELAVPLSLPDPCKGLSTWSPVRSLITVLRRFPQVQEAPAPPGRPLDSHFHCLDGEKANNVHNECCLESRPRRSAGNIAKRVKPESLCDGVAEKMERSFMVLHS